MDNSSAISLVFRLVLGAGIIIAVYYLLFGRRAEFVVAVHRGAVRGKGKIPHGLLQGLTPFLLDDLEITDGVRMYGIARGKQIRVWFRGRITAGNQQRIRNFLNSGG
jgi:hypothetical protein